LSTTTTTPATVDDVVAIGQYDSVTNTLTAQGVAVLLSN
jgi:hypothetical protein